MVLIFKDDKVLLGQRLGNDGAMGMYAVPGGHLEHLESLVACAQREVTEEADIDIDNIQFVGVANIRHFAPRHHVIVLLKANWKSGEPRVCEPDKCSGWGWYGLDALPRPLTPATESVMRAIHSGQQLFDGVPSVPVTRNRSRNG
ncbi:MAG: NUDIX domain-containing protein [Candidatus Kerfeldbacteria bacterium]|nr:NUDIX domain-containing protein [Candidatus Kerfeldbacteria bacterium]